MIKPLRALTARIRAWSPQRRGLMCDECRTAKECDQLHQEIELLRAMLAEERAFSLRFATAVRADQVRAGQILVWMGGSHRNRVESVTVEDGRVRIYLGEGYGACIERADQEVKVFAV